MLLLSIWRHSQVVRQRSAKSPPPVRVWVSPPKRRTRRSRVLLFGFRALWALHLFDFICSGGMNPPGIKVLPAGKTLVRRKSAAPLCGAPGSGIYSVKTLQKERHSFGNVFLFGFRRLWRLHPIHFICSGRVNRPGIKVLGPRPKTLVRRKSAAPPCGAPGSAIHSVKILQKEGHDYVVSFFLGFAPRCGAPPV